MRRRSCCCGPGSAFRSRANTGGQSYALHNGGGAGQLLDTVHSSSRQAAHPASDLLAAAGLSGRQHSPSPPPLPRSEQTGCPWAWPLQPAAHLRQRRQAPLLHQSCRPAGAGSAAGSAGRALPTAGRSAARPASPAPAPPAAGAARAAAAAHTAAWAQARQRRHRPGAAGAGAWLPPAARLAAPDVLAEAMRRPAACHRAAIHTDRRRRPHPSPLPPLRQPCRRRRQPRHPPPQKWSACGGGAALWTRLQSAVLPWTCRPGRQLAAPTAGPRRPLLRVAMLPQPGWSTHHAVAAPPPARGQPQQRQRRAWAAAGPGPRQRLLVARQLAPLAALLPGPVHRLNLPEGPSWALHRCRHPNHRSCRQTAQLLLPPPRPLLPAAPLPVAGKRRLRRHW